MEVSLAVYEEITGQPKLPPPVDEADYERRKYRRVPFGHRATVSPTSGENADDGAPDVVMVRDVSVGGISFLHLEAIRPGTPFIVEFRGHHDRAVKLRCTTTRCEPGGSGGAQFVIGAQFEELLTKEIDDAKPAEAPTPTQTEAVEGEALGSDIEDNEKAAEPATVEGKAVVPERQTNAVHMTEPAAPVPAAAPAPRPSGLFKAADPAEAKKPADGYWADGTGPATAAPKPAAPASIVQTPAAPALVVQAPATPVPTAPAPVTKPPVEAATISEPADGPVFRVVPLPADPPKEIAQSDSKPEPAPEPAPVPAVEPSPTTIQPMAIQPEPVNEPVREPTSEQTAAAHSSVSHSSMEFHGKTHEILARVKGMLVEQEKTIATQKLQIKEHRQHFEKEIKLLRAELAETRNSLAELKQKSAEDDNAIAELASFLDEHTPGRKNQAA